MAIAGIVVGIDGSDSGYDALTFCLGLAAREHAFLNACFVSHKVAVPTLVGTIAWDTGELAESLEQRVNEELKRADVGGMFFLREGDIATELKRLAHERVADLIAVGRSRHPRLHLGSVPRCLLDTPDHALLIVP